MRRQNKHVLAGGAILYRRAIMSVVIQHVVGLNPDLSKLESKTPIIENLSDSIGLFSSENGFKPPTVLTRSESENSDDIRRRKRSRISTESMFDSENI